MIQRAIYLCKKKDQMEGSIPVRAASRYAKVIEGYKARLKKNPDLKLSEYCKARGNNGTRRGCIFYSLACSCREMGINFFEYLSDVLNRAAAMPPGSGAEAYRNLLPDRWNKEYVNAETVTEFQVHPHQNVF